MKLVRARDLAEFERIAGPFLAAREAENNGFFGILSGLREGLYRLPPYLAAVMDGDEVVVAALRTPPFPNAMVSCVSDDALPLLVDDLRREFDDLGGVIGESGPAKRFAGLWTERTGRIARLQMAERNFLLRRVIPPRPVAGRMRIAEQADRELLAAWLAAFTVEALGPDQDTSRAMEVADNYIARRGRTPYLWDDGGAVSLCGVGGPTPHGVRVGPVYTPPERRRRGYASALVAAASQAQLDAGRTFCFLFTDLANPTSNHIYQAIGYEPVCDFDQYRFDPPAK